MDEKTKALEMFLKHEAKTASGRFVLSAMEHMKKEEAPERIQEFTDDFRKLFQLCSEKKQEVCFVQIVLMRARALRGKPFYLLEAYDKNFYLSEPLVRLQLRLEWLYLEYRKYCREIEEQSKKYIQCFTEYELNRIKLAELINCRRIVRHLFEESIVYIINTEEYRRLNVQEGFQMHMAEYRGPYEKIFEQDQYTDQIGAIWYGVLQDNAEKKG